MRHKKKEHVYVLTISSLKGQTNIINLLNGKQRTPKDYQFKGQIHWMNENSGKGFANVLVYKGKNTGLQADNYWLAGFIDADGSFDIPYVKAKDQYRVRFRQTQRQEIENASQSYSLFTAKRYDCQCWIKA